LSVAAARLFGMLTGRLLTESLRVGIDLSVPDLRLVRLGSHDVSASVEADQPSVWTFVDFEAPDDRADQLADALAVAWGRAAGTPEHQLDWGD
jgi:hypothetical protein